MHESVDPAGREQMYVWDAGTLGMSGMHYVFTQSVAILS